MQRKIKHTVWFQKQFKYQGNIILYATTHAKIL